MFSLYFQSFENAFVVPGRSDAAPGVRRLQEQGDERSELCLDVIMQTVFKNEYQLSIDSRIKQLIK